MPLLAKSLSARLLVLTAGFVMLSEVLIYAPSIARYRLTYLERKLGDSHIAALTLEATPTGEITPDLEDRLLRHIEAIGVEITIRGDTMYMLGHRLPPRVDARFDISRASVPDLIVEAFRTLLERRPRIIQVVGPSPYDPAVEVEAVLNEAPLRAEMLDFSWRILQLSIVISLITAALVFLSLRWLLVRPLQRLTRSMVRFAENPQDQTRMIQPSARADEVGVAERELALMQAEIRRALAQRTHLAALGEAVTRINHDLRNILASAHLVADRLEASADPAARKAGPRLAAAIDRATALCSRVLEFARAGGPELRPARFPVAELIEEVGAATAPEGGAVCWKGGAEAGLELVGDRALLHRALVNLARNAVEAGATRIDVTAAREGERVVIDVADNGPGIPARSRARLFQPFAGSSKPDGSGLGLAIAREMALAHGGDLRLLGTGPTGTAFRLDLPAAS